MAGKHDEVFHPSSPHSSNGGGESFKGTPDTKLSAFSPGDSFSKSTKAICASRFGHVETSPMSFFDTPARAPSNLTEKDPFVLSSRGARGQPKLSPTASSFRPVRTAMADSQALSKVAHGVDQQQLGHNTLNATRSISRSMSSVLGISRLVGFSSPKSFSVTDVNSYVLV
jgi:hypothetical protein